MVDRERRPASGEMNQAMLVFEKRQGDNEAAVAA